MAATMDIRLNYGAWSGDDGEPAASTSSREATPAFYPPGQTTDYRHHTSSTRQPSAALSLSDLFSDSDDSINTQDLLDAEMSMGSSASTSQNNSRPPQPPRGSEGSNLLNATQNSTYDSPVIDLTDSPPQPSVRPTTDAQLISPQPTSQEQSNMPPTLRSSGYSGRAHGPYLPAQPTEERPRKRRRLSERSTAAERPQPVISYVEVQAVDLTEVNDESDLSKAISKQQQDAVHAQMKKGQGDDLPGRTPLSSYKCPICMDTPEDATSTICGR
jgi:hypothetical protein